MRIAIFILASLFFVPTAHAQEQSTAVPPVEAFNFTRTIIVQTDLEDAVPSHNLTCRIMPKKLGVVKEHEVEEIQLTTNEYGEAVLGIQDNSETIMNCSSTELTTQNHCWFFPNSTTTFEIFDNDDKNKPVYLISQESPETCDQEFTQEKLEEGLAELVPQGTVQPFTNKNINIEIPTPNPDIQETNPIAEDITLWQWIVLKFNSIFNR